MHTFTARKMGFHIHATQVNLAVCMSVVGIHAQVPYKLSAGPRSLGRISRGRRQQLGAVACADSNLACQILVSLLFKFPLFHTKLSENETATELIADGCSSQLRDQDVSFNAMYAF
jgi:hypothetical protein